MTTETKQPEVKKTECQNHRATWFFRTETSTRRTWGCPDCKKAIKKGDSK